MRKTIIGIALSGATALLAISAATTAKAFDQNARVEACQAKFRDLPGPPRLLPRIST
jgi:hypothetical protein